MRGMGLGGTNSTYAAGSQGRCKREPKRDNLSEEKIWVNKGQNKQANKETRRKRSGSRSSLRSGDQQRATCLAASQLAGRQVHTDSSGVGDRDHVGAELLLEGGVLGDLPDHGVSDKVAEVDLPRAGAGDRVL